MNEIVFKGLLKTVKNFLPPASIKEAGDALIKTAVDFKNKIEINTDAGEVTAAGIVYEQNQVIYLAIAVFDNENKITRFEHVQELNQVINNLIKKL